MTKPEEPQESENICLSSSCVLAASEILENMSPRYHEIDPCTNFENFVCDGWAEKHDLRADQGSSFTGTIMAENSQQILRHVLESSYPISSQDFESHSVAKQKIFEKLHDVYEACMNEGKLKEIGSAPLLNILRKIETLYNAKRPHDDTFFSSQQGQKGLSEDADDPTKYYNPLTVDETQALLLQVDLKDLIYTLAPSGFSPEKLIVGSPSYLRKVSTVLQDTTAEVLQAYFVWKTVQTYAYKIEDDALKPLVRFNNELQGKDPDASEERWRTCIKVADNGLGWILSKFFVEKAFSKEAKEFGDRIVYDIKDQFIKKLLGAEWMSEDVRQLGLLKVHNIVQKIGYPTKSPDIRDSSALDEYYEDVDISSTAFFENALSIAQFDVKREWSVLGKPTNRDEWGMTADTVNAYYNPAGNEIVFPAGIMQSPVFYDPSVPQYLSYGAFGSVSGHELSHAFDSTGRHYDETGNFTDWWNDKTVEAFEEKAKCFVDQYHDFTVPNPNGEPLHVNGRLTLGENIADAGGLNAAFAAWKQRDKKEPEQLLPGLQHFSKEQMFFISYSNWWCGKTRPETAVNLVYRDPHSPTWARIIGTMANSRDFKEAFSCPSKEPTCELW
ncbi:hypothetical protein P7C71_g6112, partial [Lecanoromycetidae sp. Uapishka_2]